MSIDSVSTQPEPQPSGLTDEAPEAAHHQERSGSSPERSIWLWGLVPVVFAGLRVLVVSRGDPETLRALVQNLNVPALTLATLLPVGATLASWLTLFSFMSLFSTNTQRTAWRASFFLLLPSSLILVWYAMPLLHIVGNMLAFGAIIVILIAGFILGHKNARGAAVIFTASAAIWLATIVIAPFILLLAQAGMWLPQETLEIEDVTVSPVYILSATEQWTTYMNERHKVLIMPTRDIRNRSTVGSPDSIWRKPLAELFGSN